MTHQRIDFKITLDTDPSLQLAATLHLPAAQSLTSRPPLFICMPGGGYNRLYYDLPEPGYSQAEYHAARGIVTVTLDHLGVGESSLVAPEVCTLGHVADANAAAVRQLLAMLRIGINGAPAIDPGAVIGVGQSMGGFVTVVMQARRRSFDAIAVLGASAVHTRFPSPVWQGAKPANGDADSVKLATEMWLNADWRFAFHWDDVPAHLVDADMECKPPIFGAPAPWISPTIPTIHDLLLPGVIAREAAMIDVPVLLAMGERDVTQDPLRELAAFQSAPDLALSVFPRMAHMHNFAGTRVGLWRRLQAFGLQITGQNGF